jgi:hypothetical protein
MVLPFITLLLVRLGVHTTCPHPQEKPRLSAKRKSFSLDIGILLRGDSLILSHDASPL